MQSKEKRKLSLLTTKFSDEAWGDNHKNKVVYRAQDRFHNPLFIVLMAVKKSLIIKN